MATNCINLPGSYGDRSLDFGPGGWHRSFREIGARAWEDDGLPDRDECNMILSENNAGHMIGKVPLAAIMVMSGEQIEAMGTMRIAA